MLGDDQAGIRAGVRRALEPQGFRVLAEAGTADGVVAAALRYRPQVCVLGVHIPGNGIAAAERIREELPQTRIVMLTASDADEDLFAALRAGADGYLLKTMSAQRLPEAIRGVLAGEAAIPRMLTARLIKEYRARGRRRIVPGPGAPVAVSGREFEVLSALRKGRTTAEIADALGVSQVTVRRHISAVMHKLGVHSRQAALELVQDAVADDVPVLNAESLRRRID
ncbi:MAG TPA: response regulator transcription factor [Solirubrobacteraceae bacterium]|nr:response regulator transcription factor [Solirubrobacteraceae bacterium]